MNIELCKKMLSKFETQTKKSDSIWKPEGTSIVRIVPYKFNKDNPFIELYFHYGFGNKSYLSPITFGRPDPIMEYAEALRQNSKDKETYILSKKIEPKLRTYVPVIIRGDEKSGVKFWGFGKTIYQELLKIITDPDYGDISDPSTGRDITVEFQSAEELRKDYPTTTIRVKPNQSKMVVDAPTFEIVMTSQKEITDVFKEPTYEELEDVLNNWLNGNTADSAVETKPKNGNVAVKTATPIAPSQKPVVETKKTTSTPAPTTAANDELEAEFKKMFEN